VPLLLQHDHFEGGKVRRLKNSASKKRGENEIGGTAATAYHMTRILE